MVPLRTLFAAVAPMGMMLSALLNARAISTLVEATLLANVGMPSVTGAGLRQAPATPAPRSAAAILARNPFDHATGRLGPATPSPEEARRRRHDPASAPLCEGVRPRVVVGADDPQVAFAALEIDGGKRVLRRRGDMIGDARVAYVARDRVWLEEAGGLCQALLFGPSPAPAPSSAPRVGALAQPGVRSALEIAVSKQIVKTGPNEYAIDRSAVERILEAQQELMKQRLVAQQEGGRVVGLKVLGIKPGSLLAMLGIEDGDRLETINGYEVSSPEKMLEAYARLRMGGDRLQVHLTRSGAPLNLDYAIR